jgi:hypothetical protein
MTGEMDVNYLLHRQQVSLIRAQMSRTKRARTAYEDLARGYTDQIDAYREENVRMVNLAH